MAARLSGACVVLMALSTVLWSAGAAALAGSVSEVGAPALSGQHRPGAMDAGDQEVISPARYRRVVADALDHYRAVIAKSWKHTEVSSPTKWVEYSHDWRVRRVVDYGDHAIRISLHFKAGRDLRPEFLHQLTELLSEDLATAYARDPVLVDTARRLGLTARLEADGQRVLGELFATAHPHKGQFRAEARRLLDKGRIDDVGTGELRVATLTAPLPAHRLLHAATRYRGTIRRYGAKWKIDPALIAAVIASESDFNPMAMSKVPAFGLMQLAPGSFERGTVRTGNPPPGPAALLNPAKNIRLGAAYLHRLYYRDFSGVGVAKNRDRKSVV